jgi:hypothetical protein
VVVSWRENEVAQDEGRVRRSLGAETSSWDQGPNFDLIGTLRTVVVHGTPGATCMMCWSGSSPAGCLSIRVAATLSDMSGRLSVVVIS